MSFLVTDYSLSIATDGLQCALSTTLGISTDGLQCSALEIEAVIGDPLHISRLQPGDQVKIVISPRYQLVIVHKPNGPVLEQGRKGRNTRGHTKTVLEGTITSNSPTVGEMSLNVTYSLRRRIPATIPYNHIRKIHKIVSFSTIVETMSRPGGQALGTKLPDNTLLTPRHKLIPIKT